MCEIERTLTNGVNTQYTEYDKQKIEECKREIEECKREIQGTLSPLNLQSLPTEGNPSVGGATATFVAESGMSSPLRPPILYGVLTVPRPLLLTSILQLANAWSGVRSSRGSSPL